MKTLIFPFLILLLVNVGYSQNQLPTEITMLFNETDLDIVVDGKNEESFWSKSDILDFLFTFQYDMPSNEDISAIARFAWKENLGLYAFIEITDDMQHYLEPGGIPFEYDCVEFFFYWGNEGDWGPKTDSTEVVGDSLYSQIRIQLTNDYQTTTDGTYLGQWDNAAPLGKSVDGKMEAVAKTTAKGWNLEVIFPFDMFAMKNEPKWNLSFGFEIIINDSDEGDLGFQLSLLNDSKEDLAWTNKAYLNTAVLSKDFTHIDNIEKHYFFQYLRPLDNKIFKLNREIQTIEIYSISGTKMFEKHHVIGEIDLSNLNSGVYIAVLNDAKKQKIVIR